MLALQTKGIEMVTEIRVSVPSRLSLPGSCKKDELKGNLPKFSESSHNVFSCITMESNILAKRFVPL